MVSVPQSLYVDDVDQMLDALNECVASTGSYGVVADMKLPIRVKLRNPMDH
jgi:hypothetical protein